MFHMLNGPRPFPAADREQKLGRGMMENKNRHLVGGDSD